MKTYTYEVFIVLYTLLFLFKRYTTLLMLSMLQNCYLEHREKLQIMFHQITNKVTIFTFLVVLLRKQINCIWKKWRFIYILY